MAMKLVLDTNAYCLCDTGDDQTLKWLERAQHLFLPTIVYGELYHGFIYGSRLTKNLERLDEFIDSFDVEVIEVNLDVAQKFGEIFASLRKKGAPIPTNDIWISACCQDVGGILLTADQHFLKVEQIQVALLNDKEK
jgi:tRNA(fMet)-specific endonuclease VapC